LRTLAKSLGVKSNSRSSCVWYFSLSITNSL
jgi:hypothetical protein